VYARVIVGTDGSQRAQLAGPIATDAAAAFACPLESVHVRAEEDLADLDLAGVRFVTADDPASGLIALAAATDPPGLLCLATRGRHALGEAVFGSVTSQVLRELHAPMLVVGPSVRRPSTPWRRMLVCLDGSDTAAEILPVAEAWARHLDLDLELLHVAYPLGDPRSGDFLIPEEERAAAEQVRTAAEALTHAGVRASWAVIEHAHLAEGIAQTAARGSSSLLALATHGRTGLARLIAGSVALDVIRRATVPVLTLRPEHLR
jgi:nucleotide-binding universal stress UspA family protein